MDKLETTKSANALNDAIVDDMAAKAYIENFALETFNRADEAQRAGKVGKQTADTFMAAATFLDLLAIWGEVEAEFAAKSKFGKFHARRILLAVKSGEDPNASNPVIEEVVEVPSEESVEGELRALEGAQNGVGDGDGAQIPMLEGLDHQVSPIDPPDASHVDEENSRHNSIGGGYFPTSTATAPAAPDLEMPDSSTSPPKIATPIDMNPQDYYNTLAPPPASDPSAPSPEELGITSPARPSRPTPEEMGALSPIVSNVPLAPPQALAPPAQPPPPAAPILQPGPIPAPVPVVQQPPTIARSAPASGYKTDDEAVMLAQKHARWAISALNFEDVGTAVKELGLALRSLGAG